MNKYHLQGKIKSTGVAILFWFLIGAHFAYLDKWGLQLLFWLTIGGLGIWWLIELFLIPGRVATYNEGIFKMIDEIDKKEKAEDLAKLGAVTQQGKS